MQRDLHDWRAIFAFTQSPNGSFAFNFLISLKAEPELKFDYHKATYRNEVDLPGQIKQVALDYGLMSAFTAFVAVDTTRRTEEKEGTTVPVAVPVPEGVKYETTVKGEK